MKSLVAASLLLVLVLVSVSAYLRLAQSGIGCTEWPGCYGNIGLPGNEAPTAGSTFERLAEEASQPNAWATRAHRLVASILGLAVLAIALQSLRLQKDRVLSFVLLGLTVFLAWLGIHSGELHSLAVVMGNLGGGFAMLGVLGWMAFAKSRTHVTGPRSVRNWLIAAVVLVSLQIGLGGLTSANFATAACQTLPDCHGSYLPDASIAKAFDLTRELEIGPTGLVLGGAERASIHKLHRLGAVATAVIVLIAGILALRAGAGIDAAAVLILVIAEIGVGIGAILSGLPIAVAVAHNWLAALLLLALLRSLALCNDQRILNESA